MFNKIKKHFVIGATLLFLAASPPSVLEAATYYVDATSGTDANNGTSTATPWKTLTKVNTPTYVAGDVILFKTGETWSGQLTPKGSGNATNSIQIGKYGAGTNPVINGGSATGKGTVYLKNQQYWEISDLEVTAYPGLVANFYTTATAGDRRGVYIALSQYGTCNHVYLRNLNVHHVKGIVGDKSTGGIYFAVESTENTSSKSRFNDVLVEGCTISYIENTGLSNDNEWNVYYPGGENGTAADRTEYANWLSRRNTNLIYRNNTIHHIAKNAIVVRMADETCLVEYNVCYETAIAITGNTIFTARCKGTVFQYNEGYYNRSTTTTGGTIDGSLYDADFGSVYCVFQYSYSHDNSEGLYWGCNSRGSSNNTTGIPDPGDVGCTVRYNVSQGDFGDLVFLNYSSAGNEIYNNVFYIKSGTNPNIIHENSGNNHTYNFFNNIIYNLSATADYAFGSGTGVQTRTISNNLFYGNHHSTEPADPFKITSDPLFVNPASGGFGIATVNGYKLQNSSPAINAGKIIGNNGGKDYWSNPLYISAPDIGAFESTESLPLDWVRFAGKSTKKGNDLTWTTANEVQTNHFDIEKSSDGKNFATIGIVKSQNRPMNDYSFTDAENTGGVVYYRLKQVDADGQYRYSKIISLRPALATIKVYPNPASYFIKIETDEVIEQVEILNALGQVVKTVSYTHTIPIAPLSNGVYWLRILYRDNRFSLHAWTKN